MLPFSSSLALFLCEKKKKDQVSYNRPNLNKQKFKKIFEPRQIVASHQIEKVQRKKHLASRCLLHPRGLEALSRGRVN
jgi:hypothetical protein